MTAELQPDQSPARWDDHVCVYEEVFEPLSLALAAPAIKPLYGQARHVLDVACGPGGATLELARTGCAVTAVDASAAMVARTLDRARVAGLQVDARVMDAAMLSFPDAAFDAAISVFGIVLVPNAVSALAEMRRVVRPGGSIALVTWTEPQNYELATMLGTAIDGVWPDRPRSGLPAQLRYCERADFVRLFCEAGLPVPNIERIEADLTAPDAACLVKQLAFAPGMASMLSALGRRREAALARFEAMLTERFGDGKVRLTAVAHIGTCSLP